MKSQFNLSEVKIGRGQEGPRHRKRELFILGREVYGIRRAILKQVKFALQDLL
jgi:hypothetical protein